MGLKKNSIQRIYGYPYKSHGEWLQVVKTWEGSMGVIRRGSLRSIERFRGRYGDII